MPLEGLVEHCALHEKVIGATSGEAFFSLAAFWFVSLRLEVGMLGTERTRIMSGVEKPRPPGSGSDVGG